MIGMVRDTYRAILVVVVVVLLREVLASRQPVTPPPAVATSVAPQFPPAWQPAPVIVQQAAEPPRPLRRVAAAVTELGDSFLGVIR